MKEDLAIQKIKNTTDKNPSNSLQQHCTAKPSKMQMYVLQENLICYGWSDCFAKSLDNPKKERKKKKSKKEEMVQKKRKESCA